MSGQIAVGSGLAAQLSAIDETTFGVSPALTNALDYEFKSETLNLNKTTVTGEGLAAGRVYQRTKRRVLTNYDVAGGINLEAPTRQLTFWLRHMLGSFGQTLAAPTEIGTTGIYRSVHQPGSLNGHSFTIQKGVPATDGTVEPFTYVGCKITDWDLKISTGAIVELDLTIDARNELGGSGNSDPLNGSVPALRTWAGPPTDGLGELMWSFKEATIFTGGTPAADGDTGEVSLTSPTAAAAIRDVDIKHSVKLDQARFFLGSNGFKAEQIENNYRAITGTMTAEWLSSEAMYNAFSADTTTSLKVTLTGAAVSSSHYLLEIIIPNIKLDGETPKVGGPAVVTQSVAFTGLDDEATQPIQIAYQSEDDGTELS